MNGYDEALVHLGDELEQARNEDYKWGWMNALTVLKVSKKDTLWYWYDPGVLDCPNPPFKFDSSWIPTDAIPISPIKNTWVIMVCKMKSL